jgi:hypothetical protein
VKKMNVNTIGRKDLLDTLFSIFLTRARFDQIDQQDHDYQQR